MKMNSPKINCGGNSAQMNPGKNRYEDEIRDPGGILHGNELRCEDKCNTFTKCI